MNYLTRAKKFSSDLIGFVKCVAEDPRIPSHDKKVILTVTALIISPIDIIPDWIPVIGWLDDLVLLAIILDYFFNVLDQDILLSHYPWGLKSFIWMRRLARTIAVLTPQFVKDKIWKYRPDPLKGR